MTDLILASASPRRRELLARLGVTFRVVTPDGVDESAVGGAAFGLCQELARRKAAWVLEQLEADDQEAPEEGGADGRVVLASDTVVAVTRGGQERVLGKPRDREDARRTLRLLSGSAHRVLTGVAIARSGRPGEEADAQILVEAVVTWVTFRELSDDTIDAYVESGDADDKAGAYGIQSGGEQLVESIRGCYYNVIGLPLKLVSHMLELDPVPPCDCPAHALQCSQNSCDTACVLIPDEPDLGVEDLSFNEPPGSDG